jgi:hypothetical protein
MFCATGHVFGAIEGVMSCFRVLRARIVFGSTRASDPDFTFSCFDLTDSFSVERRVSGSVFIFCAPGLVFGGTEGVKSRFHVLRPRTRFRRYRGCRVSCLRFACPDSFSAVPRAFDPVFMFSAPGHVFGGAEGVGSRFHVLRSRTHFRRNRGRRLLFSCFAFLDSFLAVRRVPGPVFMFCAPGLILGGTEGIGSLFMFCAPGLVFGVTVYP